MADQDREQDARDYAEAEQRRRAQNHRVPGLGYHQPTERGI